MDSSSLLSWRVYSLDHTACERFSYYSTSNLLDQFGGRLLLAAHFKTAVPGLAVTESAFFCVMFAHDPPETLQSNMDK